MDLYGRGRLLRIYNLDNFDPDLIEEKLKELNRPRLEVNKLPSN